jgi:hypothetical protein
VAWRSGRCSRRDVVARGASRASFRKSAE